MSRIGTKPVAIPAGVEITLNNGTITVKGKEGELSFTPHPNMTLEHDADAKEVRVSRPNDLPQNRALHGLTRSLINNMVTGVQAKYEKRLEIHGVGYNASLANNKLSLQVGYANTVVLPVPQIVDCEVQKNTLLIVKSCDKQAVGQFAAEIRRVRPPEPYKGKGIRYSDEHVRRKAGKTDAKK